jgi:methyl-accepting chemotaxis protein
MRPKNDSKKFFQDVQSALSFTKGSAENIFESSQQSALTAAQEAAAIQESVAAMSEMNSMLQQTNLHSQKTKVLTEVVLGQTREGAQTVENLNSTMNLISEANERLKTISQIIDDIAEKTNVIDEIVFKTQLLAVNASIEAARAGAQGKGFQVVAGEVANLATMSGKASRTIRALLEESRGQVHHIVENTSSCTKMAQSRCRETLTFFATISESIENIAVATSQISVATREQQTGVEQLSEAMAELNKAATSNNRQAQETLKIAEEMKHSAGKLQGVYDHFGLSLEKGKTA